VSTAVNSGAWEIQKRFFGDWNHGVNSPEDCRLNSNGALSDGWRLIFWTLLHPVCDNIFFLPKPPLRRFSNKSWRWFQPPPSTGVNLYTPPGSFVVLSEDVCLRGGSTYLARLHELGSSYLGVYCRDTLMQL